MEPQTAIRVLLEQIVCNISGFHLILILITRLGGKIYRQERSLSATIVL
jgi:hypothetical protein